MDVLQKDNLCVGIAVSGLVSVGLPCSWVDVEIQCRLTRQLVIKRSITSWFGKRIRRCPIFIDPMFGINNMIFRISYPRKCFISKHVGIHLYQCGIVKCANHHDSAAWKSFSCKWDCCAASWAKMFVELSAMLITLVSVCFGWVPRKDDAFIQIGQSWAMRGACVFLAESTVAGECCSWLGN